MQKSNSYHHDPETLISAAILPMHDAGKELWAWKALKFVLILGLHVALVAWIAQAQFSSPPEPVAIRMDVRTIEIPPPRPPEVPKPVPPPPKLLPQAAKPVTARRPAPVTQPPVLTAAPSAEPAPAAFAVPVQTPVPAKAVESAPAAQPAPQPVPPASMPVIPLTAARFDADYLQNPAPPYPPMSRKFHEEGKVLLQVNVAANGTAEQVQIKQSSGYPRLDDAALNIVRQWRFVPARRGTQAVAASVVVPIVFRLDN